jgi:hypothetical protein
MHIDTAQIAGLQDELDKIAEFKMRHLALLGALATGTGVGEGYVAAHSGGHQNVGAAIAAKVKGQPFDGYRVNEAREALKRTVRLPPAIHADTPPLIQSMGKRASMDSATKGALIGGALGAGRGAMKTWERSIDADQANVSDAKKKKILKSELKKALVSTGIGAIGGGFLGHHANKIYNSALDTGVKVVERAGPSIASSAAQGVKDQARGIGFEAVRGGLSALNPFRKA